MSVIGASTKDHFFNQQDPLLILREKLAGQKKDLDLLEKDVKREIKMVVQSVIQMPVN